MRRAPPSTLNEAEPHARQKVVMDIIQELKKDFPKAGDALDATFGLTADMKEVAEARFKEMTEQFPDKWLELGKKDYQKPKLGW